MLLPVLLCVGVLVAGLALAGGFGPGALPGGPTGPGSSAGSNGPGDGSGGIAPTPTSRPPIGGTELYGYLPYWEMTDSTAAYLETVPLSTVALFSVSARRTGELNTSAPGYERITGPIGRRIIDDAQAREARVELVFTSFGPERNGVFFGRVPRGSAAVPSGAPGGAPGVVPSGAPSAALEPNAAPFQRVVPELVGLAKELGVDGINVDVEQLDELDRAAYGEFLSSLRAALVARVPGAQVSVATEAGLRGVGNAAAAHAAGADRVFLMGYDYHWAGSNPGAVSPVERTDGLYDLRWSIDRYVEAGVPRDRILLGLPLYGMTWRTIGPDRTAPVVGSGQAWIPRRNIDRLRDPSFSPGRDPLELSELFVEPDGEEWLLTYYDSPDTLRAKLALARDHGLAGGGFWAIGYERGIPGYLKLMADFSAGKVDRSEAPAPVPAPAPG